MRILCLFLLLLTTSIVAFAQEPARVDSAHGAGDEVRRVQDALIDAYVHRDTAALDRILADEYTFINDDAGGIVNKKQILDSFRSVEVRPGSLSRLLWTVQLADERAAIKDYLISRALPHYNAALLLKMNDLLDGYVERVVKEAKLEAINLFATHTTQRIATSKFMDRVENEIFASLAEEVKKLEARLEKLEAQKEHRA